MKYHFIINPAAGKGKLAEPLAEKIKNVCQRIEADYEIYFTKGVGDATRYVKDRADGGEHSFFACGGDGTLCEVANGIMSLEDRENIYMGTVPSGTGNDFVRNFTCTENFLDVEAQINSKHMDIDLIDCNGTYAVNMINIGFDCEVVTEKEKLQGYKLFPSKLAYVAGLALTLIRKPGVRCKISFDGGEAKPHKLLLTTYGNGEFCGGGFHSNPDSSICNGKINALTVANVTRRKFISIVGSYKKGTHLKHTDIIGSLLTDTVKIDFDGITNVCIDGEITKADSLLLSTARGAVKFLIPRGSEYAKKKQPVGAIV